MELANAIGKYTTENAPLNKQLLFDTLKDLVLVLAPLAPHVMEELWEVLGMPYSVFNQSYPTVNLKALQRQTVELALQINSKIKDKIIVDTSLSKEDLEKTVLAMPNVIALLDGKPVKKVIIVPNRLVNLIV